MLSSLGLLVMPMLGLAAEHLCLFDEDVDRVAPVAALAQLTKIVAGNSFLIPMKFGSVMRRTGPPNPSGY